MALCSLFDIGSQCADIMISQFEEQQDNTHLDVENDEDSLPITTILSSQPLGGKGIIVEQLAYATAQIEWAPQSESSFDHSYC